MASTAEPEAPPQEQTAEPPESLLVGGQVLKRFLDPREWLSSSSGRTVPLILGMIVMWIAFDIKTGGIYFKPANITDILVYTSIYGIAAIGVVVVLLLGEIDLSLGSQVGMTGAASALIMSEWVPHALDRGNPAGRGLVRR